MKTIVAIICFLLLITSFAYAQDFKGLFIAPPPTPTTKAKAASMPAFTSIFSGDIPINLSGDTLYRVRNGNFDAGIGMDLASYKGLLTLRAEASQSLAAQGQFAGAGIFLNIPTFVNMIGGNWLASYVNPSIGIVPGYDFYEGRYDTAIVLSIIQVNF